MSPGKTYKHNKCLDVCFYVTGVFPQRTGTTVAQGYWVNLKHQYNKIIADDEIEVPEQEIDNWKEI